MLILLFKEPFQLIYIIGIISVIGYFTSPAAGLIGMNKTIQNALIAADRLFEIMDLERESGKNEIEMNSEHIGDIVFKNIKFCYGTRVEVFDNFSLTIPQGKLTAIIGKSGSVKTTLNYRINARYILFSINKRGGKQNNNQKSLVDEEDVFTISFYW